MSTAIQMLLAGPSVDRTGLPYREYRAGLLLSARIKTAVWLLRDEPDCTVRTQLRDIRKSVGRRADAKVTAFGPHCSRMEPTVPRETLDALRAASPEARDQAHALLVTPIPDLDADDCRSQSEVCRAIRDFSRDGERA